MGASRTLADEWAEDWLRRLASRLRSEHVRDRIAIEGRTLAVDVARARADVDAYDTETERLRKILHDWEDAHPPMP